MVRRSGGVNGANEEGRERCCYVDGCAGCECSATNVNEGCDGGSKEWRRERCK